MNFPYVHSVDFLHLQLQRYNKDINLPEYLITGVSYNECEDVRFNCKFFCARLHMVLFSQSNMHVMMRNLVLSGD